MSYGFYLPVVGVVMPSFLGAYPGCATHREEKFRRAVNSFLNQNYTKSKLIIVSDGCDITQQIYNDEFSRKSNILFVQIQKQTTFSGSVRQVGIEYLKKDCQLITYLDGDDYLFPDHIMRLVHGFAKNINCSWCYADDFVWRNIGANPVKRGSVPICERIGTSNIIHKSDIKVIWGDGYGHDWRFIKKLLKLKYKKIDHAGYVVCHVPGQFDN